MAEDIKLKKFLGYKFFKDLGNNNFEIIRVIRVYNNNSLKVLYKDGTTKSITKEHLAQYTPLEPNGLASFNIVMSGMTMDVMICLYRLIDVKIGIVDPSVVCRQGVRDFFYDLCCKGDPEKENHYVGASVSKDTCPANMELVELTACDLVVDSRLVNFYREDTIEDLIQCIPKAEFNKVLNDLFEEHLKSKENFNPFLKGRNEIDGWCKDINTLVSINNMNSDLNALQNITGVDFVLDDHLIKEESGNKLDPEALLFFNYTFRINAVDTRVIKYDNYVDLAEFNNNNYTMLRDKNKELYIIVYLVKGEFLEEELKAKMNELSITDKLGLSYINKYKNKFHID